MGPEYFLGLQQGSDGLDFPFNCGYGTFAAGVGPANLPLTIFDYITESRVSTRRQRC